MYYCTTVVHKINGAISKGIVSVIILNLHLLPAVNVLLPKKFALAAGLQIAVSFRERAVRVRDSNLNPSFQGEVLGEIS